MIRNSSTRSGSAERARGFRNWAAVAGVTLLVSSWAHAVTTGDTYRYRLLNGYNGEAVADVQYQVAGVDGDRVTMTVSPDLSAAGGGERTEVVNRDGNGLRQQLYSHGAPMDYEFAAAYPAYAVPLDAGKSWSTRVAARVAGEGGQRSVRVDGRVVGRERVRVPAGEFDVIKIRRTVYPGDGQDFAQETQIYETEWYAPALGRWVRKEIRSEYLDLSTCTKAGGCDVGGPWDVYELVEKRTSGAR